jgi:isoquinoline 1-oxidoreductase alpha subunit
MAITLKINGQSKTLNSSPDTPLLWAIRDELGMTGTKFGCGIAQCGACTVIRDGNAIRSCITPISSVSGASITTIEGLGGNHKVQQAWIAHDVPQCGYCQSGQIMSAVAYVDKNKGKNVTDAQIAEAMSGNICRCGTYNRINAAVKDAVKA